MTGRESLAPAPRILTFGQSHRRRKSSDKPVSFAACESRYMMGRSRNSTAPVPSSAAGPPSVRSFTQDRPSGYRGTDGSSRRRFRFPGIALGFGYPGLDFVIVPQGGVFLRNPATFVAL